MGENKKGEIIIQKCLPSIFNCSTTFGGADNGADGGLSTGVDALNSLDGRTTASPVCGDVTT